MDSAPATPATPATVTPLRARYVELHASVKAFEQLGALAQMQNAPRMLELQLAFLGELVAAIEPR